MWATGASPAAPDRTIEDLKSFGAPESEIQRWQQELSDATSAEGDNALPESCRRVVDMFLAVDTQWRCVVAGTRIVFIGLDYAGADRALARLDLEPSPLEFAELQLMEREALAAMAGPR